MKKEEKKKLFLYVLPAASEGASEEKLCRAALHYGKHFALKDPFDGRAPKVGRSERGKPYFVHHPEIFCSVSHSGDFWICALADFPVGADLQFHTHCESEGGKDGAARLIRIAKRWFSPEECRFAEKDPCPRFFILWTAKESYVKMTGTGIAEGFSRLNVLPEEEIFLSVGDGRGIFWRAVESEFYWAPFGESYSLGLCAKKPFDVEWILWKK
ncbi:MAG: 4'-phosphopantetheinyl transferase superfamily protein [Clostridia bacterium]|nr:4'-phosphopantetheinyl transferase superfamily protein [Clostridia bacterium]